MSNNNFLGREIGRGGFGIVYAHRDSPEIAVKISDINKESCRKWSNEYLKITTFMDNIKNDKDFKKIKYVKVIEPYGYFQENGYCFMLMPRVYRPDNRETSTIQAMLGEKTLDTITETRGQLLGLKEIRKLVPDNKLKQVCSELGTLIALIHSIGKNDMYDVELYLGKEYGSEELKFYLADFDLSETIKSYDKETVKRMEWSMSALPYFPVLDTDAELYYIFRNSYIKHMENNLGEVGREIATKIMDAYE